MSIELHNYGMTGVQEPPGIGQMRRWLAERDSPWTVRGFHVDKRAELVLGLPSGTVPQLLDGYGRLERILGYPVARPSAYLAPADKVLKMRSPWNGKHAVPMVGAGWSNNREGLPANPNSIGHALVAAPNPDKPVAKIVVHSDAPRLDVVEATTGAHASALLTWIALRNGFENGTDVVTQTFLALKAVVEAQGGRFDMNNVFAHVGFGARIGFGLRVDGALWMQNIKHEDDEVPELFQDFATTINPITSYPSHITQYTIEKQPYGLDLSLLAYLLVSGVKIDDQELPRRNSVFDQVCTFTGRDEDGRLVNASKRQRDAQFGAGVHIGEDPAPEPPYSSAGGILVLAA